MPTADLDDYLGVHALYGRYNWHLDIGDTDGMLALFLPGCTITLPGEEGEVTAATAAEVRAVVESWHADPVQRGRQHQITNLVVSPDPEGRPGHRTARTYFIVTDGRQGVPAQLVFAAWSDDVVVLTDDGWRFLNRRVGIWGEAALEEFGPTRGAVTR